MSDRLVTVATFSLPVEAHIAKTKLESEGIECFVADENIVSLNWLYSGAVGGIKLQVSEADYARAERILNVSPLDFGLKTEKSNPLACPRCHALKTRRLPLFRRLWRRLLRNDVDQECLACGSQWADEI
jgi:Putative prokaryotic signal transducing protein